MYIISKNKDYYDGVVGTVGIDKTIVYERTVEVIEDSSNFPRPFKWERKNIHKENPFREVMHFSTKSKKYIGNSYFLVGFCGKLYMGWRMFYNMKEYDPESDKYKDVEKYDIIYGYENVKKHLKYYSFGKRKEDHVKHVMDYNPIHIFRELKVPIFVYDSMGDGEFRYRRSNGSHFIINPILKEYEFYKVVDAFTAFTELQMFISGVLGTGENDIVEVEDKYKIAQHGFDKWSFRKEPEKKR